MSKPSIDTIIENVRNDYYTNHRQGEELLKIDLEAAHIIYQEEIDNLRVELANLKSNQAFELDGLYAS